MMSGAYDRGGASAVGLPGHVICCNELDLQQQRRRRLFVSKTKAAARS